ncbi:glycosyltransferase [Psychroserpens sp. Hel_I_66]|uniref:glycosyltransferase n=1 Tax=Psychroserpens sp. Hel_I_66 TaxID=1250004 RepID=UPI000648AEE6|nr:glycosyltransferase [Psychroserpens sp. Hel_I_66]
MKKVLIVSPHFPPVNAADMHRVRQSLPYFEQFGWKPTVLCVDPDYVEMAKDELLANSLPTDAEYIMVKAYSTKYTRKLGLGNLGLRSFIQLLKAGNTLLKKENFDLIYFSTTVFASMPLGRIWKRKFNIPFILDIQDPWRNDYYLTVPKEEKPPKFWFAYNLDKYLERFTVPKANGLIAVSQGYVDTLKSRYPSIKNMPSKTLTFGASVKDFEFINSRFIFKSFVLDHNKTNLIYIGRGGHDMAKSLSVIFEAFKKGLDSHEKFKKCKFWFIGTSYAPDGQGEQTIRPIAKQFGVESFVEEITDRKPYFETLTLLKSADVIVIPGSEDANYTASKLYPNLLAKKPLLCVFHSNSSVVRIVKDLNAGEVVLFDQKLAVEQCLEHMEKIVTQLPYMPETNWEKFQPFTAEAMTKVQCDFFNQVLRSHGL